MNSFKHACLALFLPIALLSLSACGGGGGSSGGGAKSSVKSMSSLSSVASSSSSVSSSSSSSVSSSVSSLSSSAASSDGLAWCTDLTTDPDNTGTGSNASQPCKMPSGFDITGAMGQGWNLGNTLDATGNTANPINDETYWGNPVTTQANIDAVHQAGFNTLRLPVSWDDHISGTDHVIDSAWLNRVEAITNYALNNGMYVIINIHHNNGWEMPTTANEANATDYLNKLWPQIANRFKDYDYHVIFEVMNEPRVTVDGTDDWWGNDASYFEVLNRMDAAALKAIRDTGGNNAKRLVMIPGYVAGVDAHQLDPLVLPNDPMIALSAHSYSPYDFALNLSGTSVFSDTQTIDNIFTRLNTGFIEKGIPVVVGEWASVNKNNLSERVKHATYFVTKAQQYKIPTIWWDNGAYTYSSNSETMGLLNRNNNTWVYPEILTAIFDATK